MNLILKQFLIIGIAFFIILWFQHEDDKKHKRERKTFYDKYKFPLLVSSIIGFVLNLSSLFDIGEKSDEILTELHIITPVEKCNVPKTFINNNFGTPNKNQMKLLSNNNSVTEQQIFTELPDF